MSAIFRNRTLAVILIAVLAVVSGGCNKLKARDNLNKGVNAYKASQYDTAIEFFKKAKELDPNLLNARLYLATAYATQYIPGAPSEENVRRGEQAIQEFQEVLQLDQNNLSAIDGIGSIIFQMAGQPYKPEKFEESKKYHQKHIQLKPEDPEPYYWVGVIDWTLAYRANKEMRFEWNQKAPERQKIKKDEDPMPDKLREEFTAKHGATVDEGIQALEKAIQIDPEYENAMAYLNLLYRQKADQVDPGAAREDYLVKADKLVDRVKEIRQKKAEQPAQPTS
jgi:tetratricopeptide (TPR) repeat protein